MPVRPQAPSAWIEPSESCGSVLERRVLERGTGSDASVVRRVSERTQA